MTPMRAALYRYSGEDFRRSFEINVNEPHPHHLPLAAAHAKARLGRIVQVTSGIQDQPELMAYAASKAALDKFVRDTVPSLRGSGVLMNLLDPGCCAPISAAPTRPTPSNRFAGRAGPGLA